MFTRFKHLQEGSSQCGYCKRHDLPCYTVNVTGCTICAACSYRRSRDCDLRPREIDARKRIIQMMKDVLAMPGEHDPFRQVIEGMRDHFCMDFMCALEENRKVDLLSRK
jgi:hypothetical protein